jgi:hypothetical protein
MLPLSDGVPARRFPVVTVLLIVANFAVWLLYELPNLNGAIFHASFYPGSRVRTWIFPIFLVRIPAWIFLGLWFLYQLIEANFGLFSASANGGGVAFFAHVGGFLFGWIVTRALTGTGRIDAQQVPSGSRA